MAWTPTPSLSVGAHPGPPGQTKPCPAWGRGGKRLGGPSRPAPHSSANELQQGRSGLGEGGCLCTSPPGSKSRATPPRLGPQRLGLKSQTSQALSLHPTSILYEPWPPTGCELPGGREGSSPEGSPYCPWQLSEDPLSVCLPGSGALFPQP